MSSTTWQPGLPHSEVPPQDTPWMLEHLDNPLPIAADCARILVPAASSSATTAVHSPSHGELPARGLKGVKPTVQVYERRAA